MSYYSYAEEKKLNLTKKSTYWEAKEAGAIFETAESEFAYAEPNYQIADGKSADEFYKIDIEFDKN